MSDKNLARWRDSQFACNPDGDHDTDVWDAQFREIPTTPRRYRGLPFHRDISIPVDGREWRVQDVPRFFQFGGIEMSPPNDPRRAVLGDVIGQVWDAVKRLDHGKWSAEFSIYAIDQKECLTIEQYYRGFLRRTEYFKITEVHVRIYTKAFLALRDKWASDCLEKAKIAAAFTSSRDIHEMMRAAIDIIGAAHTYEEMCDATEELSREWPLFKTVWQQALPRFD